MGSVKVGLLVGAAMVATSVVQAADLPAVMPPPMYQPPVIEEFGGWYLRGDIGMTNQKVNHLDNVLYATTTSLQTVGVGFDSAPLFGLGVGYQFNNWLRFDITSEWRGFASFHGLDIVNGTSTDEYRARKSEWLTLANVYVDLGTWWCTTPFIGLGIGASRNEISSFIDVNTPNNGVAFGADTAKWNFAWAAQAGLAYKVTRNFTVELAYRYLSLGNAQSGDLITFDGTNNVFNPMEFKGLTSHDLKLGVRWMCCEEPVRPSYIPPLIRKG
jgi:opacity protein-like surface antigen